MIALITGAWVETRKTLPTVVGTYVAPNLGAYTVQLRQTHSFVAQMLNKPTSETKMTSLYWQVRRLNLYRSTPYSGWYRTQTTAPAPHPDPYQPPSALPALACPVQRSAAPVPQPAH